MTDDETITALATELWRLRQLAQHAVDSVLEEQVRERLGSRLRYCEGRIDALLDGADIRMPDFAGQVFHEGLPVRAVNLSEDDTDAELIVVKTLEPTLLRDGRTISLGAVIVAPQTKRTD